MSECQPAGIYTQTELETALKLKPDFAPAKQMLQDVRSRIK
jgi:hypothetical protein